MKNNLSFLFGLKEKDQIENIAKDLNEQLKEIDKWFISFNKKYSNSIMTKATYDDPIRKPYNDMFDKYEKVVEQYRLANYYLEIL